MLIFNQEFKKQLRTLLVDLPETISGFHPGACIILLTRSTFNLSLASFVCVNHNRRPPLSYNMFQRIFNIF
jgi:hypothetical protein